MSTTNYEFITPVGSDIVNLLTQSNPNWTKADEVIKGVSDHAVGVATELKTGTVHALTRSTGSEDRDIFVFVATTNFVAGETFLLDNEQVTALTASGEQLATGCYVIGSSVLVVKKGTLLTFFVPESTAKDSQKLGGELPSHYATQSDLSAMQSDLNAVEQKVGSEVLTTTAQNCSGAINELNTTLTGKADDTYVKANELGSATAIGTTIVTVDSDGYIEVTNDGAYVYGATTNNRFEISATSGQYAGCFVRKGMRVQRVSTTGTLRFFPLS